MICEVDTHFWEAIERLLAEHRVVIDRPAGSRHPRYPNVVFPLDYGYLEGTTTSDGEGIDVWVGHSKHREVTGIACTIDFAKLDLELKILVGCTREDTKRIADFHNTKFQSAWLIGRPESATAHGSRGEGDGGHTPR